MCQVCNDTGIVYKNMGFGIEIDKCPACDKQDNSFEEFQKRLEEVKRQMLQDSESTMTPEASKSK